MDADSDESCASPGGYSNNNGTLIDSEDITPNQAVDAALNFLRNNGEGVNAITGPLIMARMTHLSAGKPSRRIESRQPLEAVCLGPSLPHLNQVSQRGNTYLFHPCDNFSMQRSVPSPHSLNRVSIHNPSDTGIRNEIL